MKPANWMKRTETECRAELAKQHPRILEAIDFAKTAYEKRTHPNRELFDEHNEFPTVNVIGATQ